MNTHKKNQGTILDFSWKKRDDIFINEWKDAIDEI